MKSTKCALFGMLSLFLAQGCGLRHSQESGVHDVVSPVTQPARTWVSNLVIGPDLKTLLLNYGYIEGSNCFQVIDSQWRDGRIQQSVELFQGPCRPFVSQTPALAVFSLRRDTSYGTTGYAWLVAGNQRIVGRVSLAPERPVLWNLCDFHFAEHCNLVMNAAGTITAFELK